MCYDELDGIDSNVNPMLLAYMWILCYWHTCESYVIGIHV